MTKEDIYDEQISPLMAQVIAICKEHKIAHIITFSLIEDEDESMACTSANISDDFNPPEKYKEIFAILYPPKRSPLMITTRDASGQVTKMEAIL